MFIRARKAPDFPPVFTVASGLSGLIPGGLVLCSQRALLPHRQPLQGASSQSASEHARDTRRHQWPVTWPIRKMCAHDAPRAYASAAVQAGWIAHVRAQLTGPTPTPKLLQKKLPHLHPDFTFQFSKLAEIFASFPLVTSRPECAGQSASLRCLRRPIFRFGTQPSTAWGCVVRALLRRSCDHIGRPRQGRSCIHPQVPSSFLSVFDPQPKSAAARSRTSNRNSWRSLGAGGAWWGTEAA